MSAPKFRKVASITRPVLKLDDGQTHYIQIEEAFRVERLTEEQRRKSKFPESEEIVLCNVTDLETGEAMQLVVRTVFRSELEEAYPNAGYVGKAFEVKMSDAGAGKRYKLFSIAEVELIADEEPAPETTKPKK